MRRVIEEAEFPDAGAEAGFRPDEDAIEAVLDVLRSGWLTVGPRTGALERAFAERLGGRHAVATSSAGGAVHLALLAAGVQADDEVLLPALAPGFAANAVVHCGARPVFVDLPAPGELRMDPAAVARLIGPRTRALLLTHLAGHPLGGEALEDLCALHGVALVHTGTVVPAGAAAVASFDADALVPGCAGGLLVTDDDAGAELARRLRSHGMTAGSWSRFTGRSAGYDAVGLGFNYRIDEPRSALALARLPHLEPELASRRRASSSARARLAALAPEVRVLGAEADQERSACLGLPVLLPSPARRREAVDAVRRARGIELRAVAPLVAEHLAYRTRFGSAALPQAAALAGSGLVLTPEQCLDDAVLSRLAIEAIAA